MPPLQPPEWLIETIGDGESPERFRDAADQLRTRFEAPNLSADERAEIGYLYWGVSVGGWQRFPEAFSERENLDLLEEIYSVSVGTNFEADVAASLVSSLSIQDDWERIVEVAEVTDATASPGAASILAQSLITSYESQGLRDEAGEVELRFIERHGESDPLIVASTLMTVSRFRSASRDLDGMIRAVEAAKGLMPEMFEDPTVRSNYAMDLLEVGRSADALLEFEMILARNPDYQDLANVLYGAGLAAQGEQLYSVALDYFDEALEMNKQRPFADWLPETIAIQQSRVEKALKRLGVPEDWPGLSSMVEASIDEHIDTPVGVELPGKTVVAQGEAEASSAVSSETDGSVTAPPAQTSSAGPGPASDGTAVAWLVGAGVVCVGVVAVTLVMMRRASASAAAILLSTCVLVRGGIAHPDHSHDHDHDHSHAPSETHIDFDFGKVLEGEVVTERLSFANPSPRALEITEYSSSCICTIAGGVRRVPAGGEGFVDVRVDTTGKPGMFDSTVNFMTTDPEFPDFKVHVSGEIIRPIGTSVPVLRVSIPYERTLSDAPVSADITVSNNTYDRMISETTTVPSGVLAIDGAGTGSLAAGAAHTVNVLIDPSQVPFGRSRGDLNVALRAPSNAGQVYQRSIAVLIEKQGPIRPALSRVSFGVAKHGEPTTRMVTLRVYDLETFDAIDTDRIRVNAADADISADVVRVNRSAREIGLEVSAVPSRSASGRVEGRMEFFTGLDFYPSFELPYFMLVRTKAPAGTSRIGAIEILSFDGDVRERVTSPTTIRVFGLDGPNFRTLAFPLPTGGEQVSSATAAFDADRNGETLSMTPTQHGAKGVLVRVPDDQPLNTGTAVQIRALLARDQTPQDAPVIVVTAATTDSDTARAFCESLAEGGGACYVIEAPKTVE